MTRLALFLVGAALIGCTDVTLRPVTLEVTDVDPSCRASACKYVTLDCVHSVRATLTRQDGSTIVGPCEDAAQTDTAILCLPQRLFGQPLFSALDPQVVASLTIEGFTTPASASCAAPDSAFQATTKGPFGLAEQAASQTPVPMRATCNAPNLCSSLLSVSGTLLDWPPITDAPPPQDSPYDVSFGYVTAQDFAYHALFQATYGPLHQPSITALGPYPLEVRNLQPPCVGYRTTLRPLGNSTVPTTVPTITCIESWRRVGTSLGSIDAFFAASLLAEKVTHPPLNIDRGVLLGQARIESASNGDVLVPTPASIEASISNSSLPFDDTKRLFYLNDAQEFVQAAPAAKTGNKGIFLILGGATNAENLLDITVRSGDRSRTESIVIVPGAATAMEFVLM